MGELESPRTSFACRARMREQASMQLMTHLDSGRVLHIQREFERRDNLVDMLDFVRIMETNLPRYLYTNESKSSSKDLSKTDLAGNLIELFREVDVNGDGFMEWEEFTRFMVEKAALFKEQLSFDKIPDYKHNTSLTVNSMGHRHREPLDAITVLPRLHQFACIEQHSPYVALYDTRSAKLATTMRCSAVPLSMCYVEPLQALVTACSDMTMARWNVGDCSLKIRYKQRAVWPTPDTQMSLCWQPAHQLVYSGSANGSVYAWDIERREQRCKLDGHSDIVMQVLSLDYLDNIVSASLDSTIRLWDSFTEQQTALLNGHSKGVNSLTYSSNHRFLISSGFDHDVFVWSPFVNTLLYKLKGHRAALVGCQAVEGTSELLSADTSGTFKLWDLRTFQCIQTFSSVHEQGDVDDLTNSLNCFAHTRLPPTHAYLDGEEQKEDFRLIAASKRLLMFDQERIRKAPVSDDGPIVVARFNNNSLTILSASERHIKIWDALLGSVKRRFDNVTAYDICALSFDDRERKFIVADVKGNISVHNFENGALMKRFADCGNSVVQLVYCDSAKAVLTAFADGSIKIFDEKDIETCRVLRSFDEAYLHRGDLSCVAFMAPSIVASGGGSGGGIRLWDFGTGKCDMVMKTPECDMVAMVSLGERPLLCVSSSDSKVRVWGVTHAVKGVCLTEFSNELPAHAVIGDSGCAVEPARMRALERPIDDQSAGSKPTSEPPRVDLWSLTEAELRLELARGDQKELEACQRVEFERTVSAREFIERQRVKRKRQLRRRSIPSETDSVDVEEGEDFHKPLDRIASVACVLEWDELSQCLFTGDDAGHLRKWSFSQFLSRCDQASFEMRPSASATQAHHHQHSPAPTGGRDESGVRFLWSQELAHDDCITSVQVTVPGRAIVTSSSDRCVKLWSWGGEPLGVLLQGVRRGLRSTQWQFRADLELRELLAKRDVTDVLSRVEQRHAMEGGLQSALDSSSVNSQREKSLMKARKQSRNTMVGVAKDRQESIQEESGKHGQVLNVLRSVKHIHVHERKDTDPQMRHRREKARRFAPHARLKDALAYPPIQLTDLGPGLDQSTRSLKMPSKTRQRAATPARLPPLQPEEVELPPIVVAPTPALPIALSEEAVKSFERLSLQLDQVEQPEGESRFGVQKSELRDFVTVDDSELSECS